MNVTNEFFRWFFEGLNGLGGWFLFFLLAAGAATWVFYDSQKRRLPALGWRMAVLLVSGLLLPVVIFRFSSDETRMSLAPFLELIFYLGLLGGVVPPVLGIGYYVTYQGLAGCPYGHVYPANLGTRCPECNRVSVQYSEQHQVIEVRGNVRSERPADERAERRKLPAKTKVNAWLVTEDGHNYQLYQGETTIGRSSKNDIQLINDRTISSEHAKIVEQNGHFRLIDRGSKNGTYVDSKLLDKEILLEQDDEVRFGDRTITHFVTTRR